MGDMGDCPDAPRVVEETAELVQRSVAGLRVALAAAAAIPPEAEAGAGLASCDDRAEVLLLFLRNQKFDVGKASGVRPSHVLQ